MKVFLLFLASLSAIQAQNRLSLSYQNWCKSLTETFRQQIRNVLADDQSRVKMLNDQFIMINHNYMDIMGVYQQCYNDFMWCNQEQRKMRILIPDTRKCCERCPDLDVYKDPRRQQYLQELIPKMKARGLWPPGRGEPV